jgi:hypothetical protein
MWVSAQHFGMGRGIPCYNLISDLFFRKTWITRFGHSCSLHTTRDDRIRELGMQARVNRITVHHAQCYANSGDCVNGMPFSLTLGCGTWGGNITSENITWKHFINTTWISLPIPPASPDEAVLFGTHWARYGKQVRDGNRDGLCTGPVLSFGRDIVAGVA